MPWERRFNRLFDLLKRLCTNPGDMARMAPDPVILNRRLNDEYPLEGPPASDGDFPYARADCHCCEATAPARPARLVRLARLAAWPTTALPPNAAHARPAAHRSNSCPTPMDELTSDD